MHTQWLFGRRLELNIQYIIMEITNETVVIIYYTTCTMHNM